MTTRTSTGASGAKSKQLGSKSTPRIKKPAERAGHVVVSDHYTQVDYIVGGYNARGGLKDVWTRSRASSSAEWVDITPSKYSSSKGSPLPRFEFDGCLVGEDVYVFGGMSIEDEEVSIFNDLWRLSKTGSSYRWALISEETPVPERSGHIVEAVKGHVLIHGGECQTQFDDLWMYHPGTATWSLLPSPEQKPCPRSGHSSTTTLNGRNLVIFGGITKVTSIEDSSISAGTATTIAAATSVEMVPEYLNDIWVLHCEDEDPGRWLWSSVFCTGLAPSPRDLPGLLSLNSDEIVIFGGYGLTESTISSESDVSEHEDNDEYDENEAEKTAEAVAALQLTEEAVEVEIKEEDESEPIDGDDKNEPLLVSTSTASVPAELEVEVEAEDEEDSDEDEEAEEEDEDAVLDYLSDVWVVKLSTGQSHPVDFEDSNNNNSSCELTCNRGSKLICHDNQIEAVGGFDGNVFFNHAIICNDVVTLTARCWL